MKKLSSNFKFLFICAIFPLIFFAPQLLKGKIPIPADSLLGLYHPWRDLSWEGFNAGKFPVKNPQINDPILQGYPWKTVTIKNFKEGHWPLWNPYAFSGQPLLANIQSSPFSVFNIFFFIFPFKIAWSLQVILPSILTAIFTFILLKSFKISDVAAIFGGIVLPFSGFFVAWLTWGTILATVMWLPLILFCQGRLMVKPSAGHFLLLVFAVSQTILSGHWQTAFYVLITSFLYLFFLILKKNQKSAVSLILGAIILGILTTAIALLPSLEFINLSARDLDQGYFPGRADWFLPLQNLIQIVAPDFFGNPARYNYWGIWNYWEFVSFIGIVPLTFALFALTGKFPLKKFLITLSFISFILAVQNPLSKVPYVFNLPLISSMQPSRIVLLMMFSLAILAAFGFDFFIKEKTKLKPTIAAIFLLVILLTLIFASLNVKELFPKSPQTDTYQIAFRNLIFPTLTVMALILILTMRYSKISNSTTVLLIFLLVTFELFRFAYRFTPFSKLSLIFPETAMTTFLSSLEKPFRIMTTDRRIMHPNTSAAYAIESVDGYDPLYLVDYAQFVSVWQQENPHAKPSSFGRIVTPQKYNSQLADILNVKYVLTFDDLNDPNFEKVFQEGQTKVFKNNNAFPRAHLVDEVVKVEDKTAELSKLLDPTFDLRKKAVSADFSFQSEKSAGTVNFINYTDQSFKLASSSDWPGALVVNNIYYPGWIAKIDGKEVEVKKVNYAFQSIIVPAGAHEVEFQFSPRSFYNGLYVSTAAIVLSLVTTFYLWRRRSLL